MEEWFDWGKRTGRRGGTRRAEEGEIKTLGPMRTLAIEQKSGHSA